MVIDSESTFEFLKNREIGEPDKHRLFYVPTSSCGILSSVKYSRIMENRLQARKR